jgi:hypothetical protein
MTGNRLSRALFFLPGALLIRLGLWLLAFSDTRIGRYTVLPLFRVFCRFALYARPYFVRAPRSNEVLTTVQLSELIKHHKLIAVIPCACRAGRTTCKIPCHSEHEDDVCMSFGLAAVIQIGSGLGKRLAAQEATELCIRAAASGLAHHAIHSLGALFEVCNCCADSCSVVKAYKAGVSEAVRPSPLIAVRGPACDGCKGREFKVCAEVCPYGLQPSSPKCLGCDLCSTHCPRQAIVMVRRGSE